MKNILLTIVAIFALASCSKDDSDIIMPTDGQYVCDATDIYFSAVLSNGKCVEFTVYTKGEYFGSWHDITNSGRYPNYKYMVDGMDIAVEFSSPNSFDALLSGVFRIGYDDNSPMATGQTLAINLTTPVQFHLDNKVLDANGDGLLDKE